MSYYANTSERTQLIAGLRDLAEFLEQNEIVPAPRWIDVMVFPERGADAAKRWEIDRVAALIDTVARESMAGQYVASRNFGPVEYRAIAIPADAGEA